MAAAVTFQTPSHRPMATARALVSARPLLFFFLSLAFLLAATAAADVDGGNHTASRHAHAHAHTHTHAHSHARHLLGAARRPARAEDAGVEASEGPARLTHGHIIPHSHCDPGWLQTFEGYYQSDVRSIISGVVNELLTDKSKRFVWSETVFFQRWYERQNIDTKKALKKLIANGQWEFVGGGWVQNDEANPSLYGIVNQMTAGHEYLLQNFGVQPRIAWQLDPFGHSSVSPTAFALMGFDALVINRIHYHEKDFLKSKNMMEFIWRGANVGVQTDMLTHVLHTHYSAPKGFDWEDGAPGVSDYNVDERSRTLCDEMKQRARAFRSNHVLVPFGDDFKFRNPGLQFSNMGRIIEHINKNSERLGCTVSYSTASEYFDHVHRTKVSFPLYDSDFFPYADNGESYWTGYYTTRPFLKTMARRVDAELHAVDIVFGVARAAHALVERAIGGSGSGGGIDSGGHGGHAAGNDMDAMFPQLLQARQDAALFLHHDAITGTARRATNEDYMRRMTDASANLLHIFAKASEFLLSRQGLLHAHTSTSASATSSSSSSSSSSSATSPAHATAADAADLSTASAPLHAGLADRLLDANDGRAHALVLFNALAWRRCELVVARVASPHVHVVDADGAPVLAQVESDPEGGGDEYRAAANDQLVARDAQPGSYRLLFSAALPAVGYATYFVHVLSAKYAPPSGSAAPAADAGTEILTHPAHIVATEFYQPGRDRHFVASWFGGGSKDPIRSLDDAPPAIENDLVKAEIASTTGLLRRLTDKRGGQRAKMVEHVFKRYSSSSSGAYLFRPQNSNMLFPDARQLLVRVFRGPVAQTVSTRWEAFAARMRLVGDGRLAGFGAGAEALKYGWRRAAAAGAGCHAGNHQPPTKYNSQDLKIVIQFLWQSKTQCMAEYLQCVFNHL